MARLTESESAPRRRAPRAKYFDMDQLGVLDCINVRLNKCSANAKADIIIITKELGQAIYVCSRCAVQYLLRKQIKEQQNNG